MFQSQKRKISTLGLLLGGCIMLFSLSAVANTNHQSDKLLTLQQIEKIALENEPGIESQLHNIQALYQQAVAEGQLMDPKVQVGINNLPIDNFKFNQEAMTQFKVGVSQQFPAGDTLKVKQQKVQKQADLIKAKVAERKLNIIKMVRLNYLELYYWQQAKITVEENKKLFAQLVNIVQSLFSVGKTEQQDLIRAQFELSKLDDRLAKIDQKIRTVRYKLARWIGDENSRKLDLTHLPKINIPKLEFDSKTLQQQLARHPKVQQIDKKLEVNRKQIAVINQTYKPGWGLNVSYGYRDNQPNGTRRSDFLSVNATFDLPVFTNNRQDKKISAEEERYLALKKSRQDLLNEMVADVQQEMTNADQLSERHAIYRKLLLPQIQQEVEASLLSYQSREGDFSDLMEAYINSLNVKLAEVRISVDHLKSYTNILYYLPVTNKQTNQNKAQ